MGMSTEWMAVISFNIADSSATSECLTRLAHVSMAGGPNTPECARVIVPPATSYDQNAPEISTILPYCPSWSASILRLAAPHHPARRRRLLLLICRESRELEVLARAAGDEARRKAVSEQVWIGARGDGNNAAETISFSVRIRIEG
ncbi:hypothetical protein GUJ93_ZPchr0006g44186 [Zizania palustris]|uniref:Uncharacterized protein n=1 Tax=Zizania palustris TaxID=103762 RepID=A0A8J5T986_ZIZPA|nr:hypothetical protein GUJ93_ZPchr0006g44186 [Zizania palustris]